MIPILKHIEVHQMEIEHEQDPYMYMSPGQLGMASPVYMQSRVKTKLTLTTPSFTDGSISYADFFIVASPRLQKMPVSLSDPTSDYERKTQQLNTLLEILEFARTNPVAREKLEDLFKLHLLLR